MRFGCTLLVSLVLISTAHADEPAVDYRTQIKPLLTKHCAKCHGADTQKAGLRLDTAAAALLGGDSGPALVAGKSEESLLVQALTGVDGVSKMPPAAEPPLAEQDIALLTAWIKQGAKAPDEEARARQRRTSQHWSFQPIKRPATPEVAKVGWVHNPIDAFVLARLEAEGLTPADEANRLVLMRRAYLDILGLLPSPREIDEFLADSSPDAYERLVDRLLDSPHYGERWGRHWLDLARYADSNGFTRDFGRSIWKYRQWVIEATNRDLPFDQFTIEQLAGDMLPNATMDQRIATGFHRNTLTNDEGGTDPEQFRVESVVDRTGTTGVVFLGLTVGCAQCHDHKYDPVSQREFYQLFAFLNNQDEPKLEVPTADQLANDAMGKRAEIRRQIAEREEAFKSQDAEFQANIAAWEKALPEDEKKKLPPLVLNTLNLGVTQRTEKDLKELTDYYKTLPEARAKFALLDEIAKLNESEPKFDTTLVMAERAELRETHVHIRGDFLRKGARVTPGVPDVLPPLEVDSGSANRLDFAKWLVSRKNPLTARVTVNRIWQRYFGRGIVETENDFGLQGSPPSHPQLLDWLATELMEPSINVGQTETPWGLKRFHKLILTSATYRQSSHARSELAEIDPANVLLARQSRLRLDAEIIRDASLSASGLLTPTLGGPSVYPPQPEGVFEFTQDKKPWPTATGPDRYRRAMYTYLWRSSPYPAMTVFDFPDANVTCTRRARSNTPLQALTLSNDKTFVEFAEGVAARVLKESISDETTRLQHAFRLCLTREPTPAELSRLKRFLTAQTAKADDVKYTALARVLLNLDEFITRE